MDSQDMKITYNAIRDRAESDAREAMPDLPKLPSPSDFTSESDWSRHCFEAWESFQCDVESLDAYDIAHEESEWDWVIYYARALELCQAVPSDVMSDAESEWGDVYVGSIDSDQFGLYEMACQLATIIVIREIAAAVESIKDELVDMAQNEMDKF